MLVGDKQASLFTPMHEEKVYVSTSVSKVQNKALNREGENGKGKARPEGEKLFFIEKFIFLKINLDPLFFTKDDLILET
jgi:hypothetical protein